MRRIRLKYRYLDLRNPEVKKNIVLRCKVVAALRSAMADHDFMEITTPILTASSPEGARDYLVPARKHPGKFYALPQAPQQFKQLLMTSGFDRYFQIAPCFRDEDARGGPQPRRILSAGYGNGLCFTGGCVRSLRGCAAAYLCQIRHLYPWPPALPSSAFLIWNAMELYGSDKPDLRIDLICQDVTELLGDCGFGPFEGQTVKALAVSGLHRYPQAD